MTTPRNCQILYNEPIYILSNGLCFDAGTIIELWIQNDDRYDVYGIQDGKQTLKNFSKVFAFGLGTICPDWDLGI